ncbi:hypothetical protein ZWY2020_059615 [Hordeum vulgare]|nr:hypothetical protein ZWY2020_059615 [Hordeum vulgare]
MQADADAGLVPTYVCATVGTTPSNADLGAIADAAAMFNAWVHVDAAYAGSACRPVGASWAQALMVMRTYGTAKLQEHIRSDVSMAKMFEDFVRADNRFEVVVPRNFALVCFRIKPNGAMTEEDADEANRVLMENLNKTGKAYLAHTVVGDRFVLRFAVGSSLQEERHVRSAWDLIKKTASSIMD